jgi:hypothetical protein
MTNCPTYFSLDLKICKEDSERYGSSRIIDLAVSNSSHASIAAKRTKKPINCLIGSSVVRNVGKSGLSVFKESHETEIHMEILMAVKQGEPGVVGDKIDLNSTEAFHENRILKDAGCFFSIDLCDLEIVPMQVERMHVVALIDEREPIAATLVNLDRLTLIVRQAIDRPDVEASSAAVDFPNFHRNHFVWRKC